MPSSSAWYSASFGIGHVFGQGIAGHFGHVDGAGRPGAKGQRAAVDAMQRLQPPAKRFGQVGPAGLAAAGHPSAQAQQPASGCPEPAAPVGQGFASPPGDAVDRPRTVEPEQVAEALKVVAVEAFVIVEHQHDVAAGQAGTKVARGGQAGRLAVTVGTSDAPAPQTLEGLGRLGLRPVIDNQNFLGQSGLVQQRIDRLCQGGRAVVRGHHDRDVHARPLARRSMPAAARPSSSFSCRVNHSRVFHAERATASQASASTQAHRTGSRNKVGLSISR